MIVIQLPGEIVCVCGAHEVGEKKGGAILPTGSI